MSDDASQDQSLVELMRRHNLCLMCLQIISEAPLDDPRREGALAEYNRQLASIDAKIAAITGKPPDIRIGLKSAILFPKAGGVT